MRPDEVHHGRDDRTGTGAAAVPGRRALLALGAAVLLGGCGGTDGNRTAGGAGSGTGGRTVQPDPSTTAPSTAGTSSAGPSRSPVPTGGTPGTCPTHPDVIAKAGTEQYLPCSGLDIALTVDDGPHPVWTPQVLALLARLDVRATFCMIGQNAARYPDLVRQVVAGGHQIANHTYTHPMDLAARSRAAVDDQVHRTLDLLTRVDGGHRPTLFRAPGGSWSPTILASCAAAGLRPLDWSVDTRDWSRPGVSHIVEVIVGRTRPGSIILDHDGGGNRQQTVTALGIALPRLIDQGYRFVLP